MAVPNSISTEPLRLLAVAFGDDRWRAMMMVMMMDFNVCWEPGVSLRLSLSISMPSLGSNFRGGNSTISLEDI
jgi:hypothetical protein